ncbi:MAG: type IV toxin-antitoxin system AbiEi family antitoxin domain-containing protein [Candidatus Limnocylindrales bacterium]
MNDSTAAPDHGALFGVASAHAGCFTASQAAAQGFSSALLSHHVRSGRFVRVARGLYRIRDYPAQPGDEIVAAWLRQAPDAVVSHESALEILDLADTIADRVHLTVPRSRRRLVPQEGVVIHTTTHPMGPTDTVSRRGMRVTAPARTIADVAAAGVAPDQVTAAVHTALARGMTTPSLLREAASARGRRVQRLIEAALSGAGG